MVIVGKEITVIEADNKTLVGLTGTVIEDNKGTLRVRTAQGEKLLVKHTIKLETEGFIMEGKSLHGTHASRTKK